MGTRGDRIKEGYLKKLPPLSRNPSRKDFKKRWFVLWESCHLAYYTKKDGEVLKEINLNTCTSVVGNYRQSSAVRDSDYALFLKTPSRDWLFVADNQDEMQAWVDAIDKLVRGKLLYSKADSKSWACLGSFSKRVGMTRSRLHNGS
jgi:hypothetical protein